MTDLHSLDDVKFDDAVCDGLVSAFDTGATTLDNHATSWHNQATTAGEGFKGRFSQLFAQNAATAVANARDIATQLREVSTFAKKLKESAHEENKRRAKAREWQRQKDRADQLRAEANNARSQGLPVLGDIEAAFKDAQAWFTEGDVQVPESVPPPVQNAPSVKPGSRQTPAPGQGGGGGGGTSSAYPDKLMNFSTNAANLNSALTNLPSSLRGKLADFASSCQWGTLDASQLVADLDSWRALNDTDVTWAKTVGEAFAKAGGGAGQIATLSDDALSNALAASNVSESRSSVAVHSPIVQGAAPTTGYANDPVNTATGNFVEPEQDLGFQGGSSSLRLDRMYNSVAVVSPPGEWGVFGPGWSSTLDIRLVLDDTTAAWVGEDGRHVIFAREGEGWARAQGEPCWLTREPADRCAEVLDLLGESDGRPHEVLVVRDNQGSWIVFDLDGTWLGQGSGPGTAVAAQRGADGRISRLQHARGRFIDIDYSGSRVASVMASDGRRVEYHYDDEQQLIGVTAPTGRREYQLDDRGLIVGVVAADGVVEVTNTYDAEGRVTSQVSEFGRHIRYVYLGGGLTVVSDDDGTRSNSWIADGRGRCIGIVDSEGARQSMAYDSFGNTVMVTEPDGATTVHEHDDRGRLRRTVTPDGGDFTYGYDVHDRLTTVVLDTGAVLEYRYDDDQHREPSVVVDPLGGETHLLWRNGLLAEVTGPTGVRMVCEHDHHGDLVAVSNAVGDVTRYCRDERGHVTEMISPSGARTRYRYDAADNIIAREDPDGAVWRYEYGTAARLTAIVDPLGGRTQMEYDASGEVSATTDPLGRRIARERDDLGNVSSLVLPDGSAWHFDHDARSLCRRIVDPAGSEWLRTFDAEGNLIETIDPTGARESVIQDRTTGVFSVRDTFGTQYLSVDAYGRPVQATDHSGASELTVYDLAGRPVELVDAEGGLTLLEYDAAGHLIKETSPAGRAVSYTYDRCGRPESMTDAAGAVTRLVYDADSRVVARVTPEGEETINYDAAGRVVRISSPWGGTTRLQYDRLGRTTFMSDQRFGQRRFAYDAAGQLTKVTNGLGGVTAYEYDLLGRVVAVTDPLGAVTRYDYDVRGKVVRRVDPLGRETRAGYDAAGRQVWQEDPDGSRTEWVLAQGRQVALKVNGATVAETTLDAKARLLEVRDLTGVEPVVHGFRYDACGRLRSRTRGAAEIGYTYDADGLRTQITTPFGTVHSSYDAAGNLRTLRSDGVDLTMGYDECGNLIHANADGVSSRWDYVDGHVVTHVIGGRDGVESERVQVSYDEQGRVRSVDSSLRGLSVYSYDDAAQLVEVRTMDADGTTERQWRYDEAGRLVWERDGGEERTFVYDDASQLQTITNSTGVVRELIHDGLGRRVAEICGDERIEYAWSALGQLSRMTRLVDGSVVDETQIWADALGELAAVNGVPLLWDDAAVIPTLLGIGEVGVTVSPIGHVAGGSSTARGWAQAASRASDPWQAEPMAVVDGLKLTGDGSLELGSLEWMGARVYDPTTRAFLSPDPLEPVIGAAWGGNPYSFAGNDPLGCADPLGLRPVSIDDLKAHNRARHPITAPVSEFFRDNWQYIAAGAVVVAGVALCATGVGGPLGATILVGAATSGVFTFGEQLITGKPIDPKAIARDVAIGGAAAFVGGVAARGAGMLAGKVVQMRGDRLVAAGSRWTGWGNTWSKGAQAFKQLFSRAPVAAKNNWMLTRGANLTSKGTALLEKVPGLVGPEFLKTVPGKMIEGGFGSGTSNALNYAKSPGPHTVGGYMQAVGTGLATSGLSPLSKKKLETLVPSGVRQTVAKMAHDASVSVTNTLIQPTAWTPAGVTKDGLKGAFNSIAKDPMKAFVGSLGRH